ncbi:AMP-binding protein [Pseudonocardia benzenivorans]
MPAGYTLLVPRLEADPGFARHFFSRLRLLFYAAAALPQALWDRLELLVDKHADHPIPLTASWGTTETAPAATSAHWFGSRCGCIGVPLPGVRLKLVPTDGKQEIRIAGPSITPGYHERPDATADAFDDEGFYRTGDAVVLVDAEDPGQGLMFDGRIAEDFKLATGTWVSVATVRGKLLSAARVLTDVVLAGHDRDEITALAWLNIDEARAVCGLPGRRRGTRPPRIAATPRRRPCPGRSRHWVCRASRAVAALRRTPDLDAGEITDKGYINQRAVLEHRADLVELLYSPDGDARMIESAPVAVRGRGPASS